MNNFIKKFTGVFLSLVIIVASSPIFSLAAPIPADDIFTSFTGMSYTFVENNLTPKKISDIDSRLSQKSLMKGAKMYVRGFTADSGAITNRQEVTAQYALLTDGNIGGEAQDYAPQLFGGNENAKTYHDYGDGTQSWETEHKYAYEFIIKLDDYYNIDAITIGSALYDSIGDHEIYIASSEERLFSGTPVAWLSLDMNKWVLSRRDSKHGDSALGINIWTGRGSELIGKYIGIRIWLGNARPKSNSVNNKYYYDRLRMNEISVYGEKADVFELTDIEKSDLVDVAPVNEPCVKGTPFSFKLSAAGGAKLTSVKYGGNTLTAKDGVYTIENTNAEVKKLVITTDKDAVSPVNGIWRGIDLTTKNNCAEIAIKNPDVSLHETAFFYDVTMDGVKRNRRELSLLYPVDNVISIRSYDLKTIYYEGKDFTVTSDGKIKLTDNTSIPVYGDDPSENEDIRCIIKKPDGTYDTDWSGQGR